MGLLVGRRTFKKRSPSDGVDGGRVRAKDSILQLVRTPDEEEGTSSLRVIGQGKGQLSLDVDTEWVCEHACQVARILPGGLSVLGVYVLCDARAFNAKSLEGLLKRINSDMLTVRSDRVSLVLHVDATRAILSAKECDGSVVKPCEIQNSSLLTEMVEFRCNYPLELCLDSCSDKEIVSELIEDLIQFEAKNRIQPARAEPNRDGLTSIEQMIARYIKRDGLDHISVSMLLPYSVRGPPALGVSPASTRGTQGEHVSGTYVPRARFAFRGVMESRAYVFKTEDFDDAILALKQDLELSLRARLDVLVEAAEMATEALSRGQQKNRVPSPPGQVAETKHPLLNTISSIGSYEPQFPQRAFLKWKKGVCTYCDYIVEGDGVSEALDRIRELVGHGVVDGTTYHCSETIRHNSGGLQKVGTGKTCPPLCGLRTMFSCNIMLAGTVVVAILAMLYAL